MVIYSKTKHKYLETASTPNRLKAPNNRFFRASTVFSMKYINKDDDEMTCPSTFITKKAYI